MKNVIRRNVFETNSSSSHVLVLSTFKLGTYDIDSLPNPLVIKGMKYSDFGDDKTYLSLKDKLSIAWVYFNEKADWDDLTLEETDAEFLVFLKGCHDNFKKVEIILERESNDADSLPCSEIDEDDLKMLINSKDMAITFFK